MNSEGSSGTEMSCRSRHFRVWLFCGPIQRIRHNRCSDVKIIDLRRLFGLEIGRRRLFLGRGEPRLPRRITVTAFHRTRSGSIRRVNIVVTTDVSSDAYQVTMVASKAFGCSQSGREAGGTDAGRCEHRASSKVWSSTDTVARELDTKESSYCESRRFDLQKVKV